MEIQCDLNIIPSPTNISVKFRASSLHQSLVLFIFLCHVYISLYNTSKLTKERPKHSWILNKENLKGKKKSIAVGHVLSKTVWASFWWVLSWSSQMSPKGSLQVYIRKERINLILLLRWTFITSISFPPHHELSIYELRNNVWCLYVSFCILIRNSVMVQLDYKMNIKFSLQR